MKVLFITNMYPTVNRRYYGIHVKEQIDFFVKRFRSESTIIFINAAAHGKFEYIRSVYKIFCFVRKKKIDIIHIHYGLAGFFLLFFKPKAKIFLTLHGSDILKEQGHYVQVALSKLILKRVHKAFVQNIAMGQVLQKINVKYEVLPCGIDSSFFKYIPSLSQGSDQKLIIFPSDPARPEKNFDLFMAVFNTLKMNRNIKISYACINGCSRSEVRSLLNRADCLVMTSLSEGSPQVVKEALACNLPVVSVPVGDVRIVLEDIPSCFISNRYDPSELALLVGQALSLPKKDIRSRFLQKQIYDNESVCKRLIENYIF